MERLKEAALEKIRCVCVYTEVRGMAQCIYPLFFLGRLLFSFFFFSYLQDSNQRPHFHHSHCKREISRILNSYFIGLFPSTRKSTKCSTGFWTLDGANIVIFFVHSDLTAPPTCCQQVLQSFKIPLYGMVAIDGMTLNL